MEITVSILEPTVWLSISLARDWFEDALKEARKGQGHDSRRREILFAVCCAESYIFEWVRDEVLNRQFNKLPKYFPPSKKRGVTEKWKDILKQLKFERLIPNRPNFGGQQGVEWKTLVKYRDGLVHAKASRPQKNSQPEEQKPVPSKIQLDSLEAGWAIQIVIERIRCLHRAVGTAAPSWLVDP